MNPSVTDATGTPPAARRIPLVRWAALGGIAYVVLFVIGMILAADDTWYVLHSAGGAGAAAMMIAASLAALASPRMPRWLVWLGVLAGISAIVSIFFIPWFVIAVWLVVASVIVFRAHVEED